MSRGGSPVSGVVPFPIWSAELVDKAAESQSGLTPEPFLKVLMALGLTWLLPGGGHLFLGRRARGLAFLVIVLTGLAIGTSLQGEEALVFSGSPLEILKSFARMAIGLPYFVLTVGFGYVGDPRALGYEYGGPFIVTAGVMNMLMMLDVWDIGHGRKP